MARRLPVLAGVLLAVLACCGPAAGQFTRFGKNKVQFTQFDWHRLETPHFDVYFYTEEEQLAGMAAQLAEAAFARLEQRLGYTVARRVPLIVYSSHIFFEQTNVVPNLMPEGVGGFTEMLKGRVALPLNGSIPEFERVLTHELVHVFTFDRLRQELQRHGITDYRPPPLWLSEGIAEHLSGEWGSDADMVLRDAVFSGHLVPIAQMQAIDGTYLMYKQGQSVCRFMEDRYGPDIFARLLSGWWRGKTFAEVFAAVTGDLQSELDRDWQYDLRKRCLPAIAHGDLPSQAARQLTREGFNMRPAVVPADGDSAAFVFFRNHRGYTHLARGSLGDQPPEELLPGERSPSIESLHPMASRPAVTRDGARLAYVAKHRGRDHLYVHDMRTRVRCRDLAFAELVAISSPAWSPDGGQLAFAGAGPAGTVDLYVAELSTGKLRRLTEDVYDDRDPAWAPGGRALVFSSDRWAGGGRPGRHNLFLLELDTGAVLQLSRGPHDDLQAAWSPDGRHLAFSSDRDTVANIYAMPVAADSAGAWWHGDAEPVTRVLTGAFDPAWLPDGTGLLFTGFEAGAFQIYRCRWAAEAAATSPALRAADPAAADSAWSVVGQQPAGGFSRQRYRRRLSLDVAQSQISQDPQLGTSGGIQLGLSDVLGDDQYFFVLSHVAGDAGLVDGINLALARLHQGRRANVLWGLFRLNDRLTSTYGRYVREERVGGYVELAYPFSRYDRVETQLSLRHADIDRQFEGQRLEGWLATALLSYTHDSSLWILTGPLEGRRYSFGVSQTVDYTSSRRLNTTLYGDLRQYLRLSRRSGLAMRYAARHSVGRLPEYFSLGGSWTLRGYPWMSLWGSKMLLVNEELRFPLVDRLMVRFPFGDIDFSSFRGAAFIDAGNAWSDTFGSWRGSFGGGARLGLGGVFVFRLDAARRTDFRSVGNHTHWDFFFGWDF